ncbi:MAG: DUF975 family protein [Candidatus Neomarinimicrobiota bacterium]|jgi:uncharacterized membrane protein
MKTENAVLMQMARNSLKNKWGLAIGTCVVYFVILSIVQMIPAAGPIVSLIIAGPLTLGLILFSLSISRGKEARFGQLFHGFDHFGPSLVTYLLVALYTFLWTLLLIVPGIIASFSYSMSLYILADDPSITGSEAIHKSKEMMNGNKGKLFCLHLRFLGWILLGILSLGIGFLWIIPYMQISIANFYNDLKKD